MTTEKRCSKCGKTKLLTDFPTRGREKDRFGNPLYRAKCKVCESEEKLAKYHAEKDLKEDEDDVTAQPEAPVVYPEFIPKAKKPGVHVKSCEDYGPWEKRRGKELSDDEKYELDACSKKLILTMLDLVLKEREENEKEEH